VEGEELEPVSSYAEVRRLASNLSFSTSTGTKTQVSFFVLARQVLLNDRLEFRSRTKRINASPYMNAGAERFVVSLDLPCR
jgi:hypothetical protein